MENEDQQQQEQDQQEQQQQQDDVDLSTLSTADKIEYITGLIADSYNINIAPKLEQFVDIQIAETIYHFQANLTLLKLYQFNPSALNKDYIAKMLAKAIMNFPTNDFLFLSYMIPSSMQKEEPLLKLFVLNGLIETCKFKEVWEHVEKNEAFFSAIPNFISTLHRNIGSNKEEEEYTYVLLHTDSETIMIKIDYAYNLFPFLKYNNIVVSSVLAITYSNVTLPMLGELVNLQSPKLEEYLSAKPNWKINGNVVSLQSESHKQKKSDTFTFDPVTG
ncbi:eukaryotic translation initiation factor 3 [Cavenderia fasciculata]|uniref:Eukaryotic translation initiation factor 3 n=1 Tax=Cavenderia fasciculata TaxID=261658 RepID=F4Q3E1_CACFS|nr:eukaryotic translation initiation factor 3 [Cavenderia fasciculata]EGG16810.1 eukaryotic translation initiation factor 3 [Cavenderia fasciculata]|eukprot:XP_004355284.1 eukaryotic translation initiation factor 3 [Cavenderia fasciculata]